ncbi:hypothetical protein KAI04_00565 [Candidatus Pacearchaeota archaeon]|nr:hypothetical protein [Candidatus Pacearchaeota archaeon]
MIEREFKYLYNEEDDILSIYDEQHKPFEFVELSDFLALGLNKDGSFNCLEISDAFNFFKIVNKKIDKDFLKNLKSTKLRQEIFRGAFYLFLVLFSKEGKEIEQSLPPLFQWEYESPLLKTLKH